MGVFDSVKTLININGINQKQLFIKENIGDECFAKFLYYALNPFLSFNLSERTLRGTYSITDSDRNQRSQFEDVFSCCEYMSRKRGVSTSDIMAVKRLLYTRYDPDDRELCIGLLSKTIRLGVTSKTVNKVVKDFIPTWEIQQAYPIEKHPLKEGEEFWLTEKLNGVRATFYNGDLISRQGSRYTGLEHITHELVGMDDWIIDGELTLKNKEGMSDNEAFRTATGIINSSSETKDEITFTVFDIVSTNEFFGTSVTPYSKRREVLNSLHDKLDRNGASNVSILPVLYHGKEQSVIWDMLDKVTNADKEGLMLNTDCPYLCTRHKGILKVKKFNTVDLPILRCEEGQGRNKGTLGSFVVDLDGTELRVGSGFTDEQRKEYWDRRDTMSGVVCEVKYKDMSSNKKTGDVSLQFPVFVRLRYDKTE